jgi:hypothetical protein
MPFSFAPVATPRITNIRKKVRTPSSTKDCPALPAGVVPPSPGASGKSTRSRRLANSAPVHWLAT